MSVKLQRQEPLRVMHLVDSLRVGGKERQVIELLKGLKKDGTVESVVVTMGRDQFYIPDVQELQIPLFYLIRRVRWDPTIFWRLLAILRKYRPHIIQTNSSMAMFYAWPLTRLMGIKLIDGTIRNALTGRGPGWLLHTTMARLADARIGNSRAGFASRGWSCDAPGNFVIYNGFDLQRFEHRAAVPGKALGIDSNGRKVVGMVAEFSDYKDFPTFIQAAQIVLSRRKDVHFVAIGGGKNLEGCKKMVSSSENAFQFLGERKDVEALVLKMDIGVLCTFTEGISNSVMEYMAAAKPVVVTDGGGSRELVLEGETGFLVPPKDPKAVARRIEEILDNEEMAKSMGAAGRRRLQEVFSMERLVEGSLQIYRFLLGTEMQPVSRNTCRQNMAPQELKS